MGIFINDMNKKEILKEYYVGRTKEFDTIEKELAKIIAKIKDSGFNKAQLRLDESDENVLIEKMFAKIFDLGGFKLHWTYSNVNAYTMITSLPYQNKQHLENMKKTGKISRKDVSMYVFVDMMLVTLADLNEKELIAIILHEIGHNLEMSSMQFMGNIIMMSLSAPPIGAIMGYILPVIQSGVGTIRGILSREIPNIIQQYLPFIYNLAGSLNQLMSELPITINILSLPNIIVNRVINTIKNPVNYVVGYGMKRNADSFSAAYGYGVYQMSALNKMDELYNSGVRTAIKNTPVLNVVNDFLSVNMYTLIYLFDPHPQHQTRATNMLNKLKRDLNNNDVPKGLKKELEAQIKLCEETYKNEFLENEVRKNERPYTMFINSIYHKIFGDKAPDLREILLNKFYEKGEL